MSRTPRSGAAAARKQCAGRSGMLGSRKGGRAYTSPLDTDHRCIFSVMNLISCDGFIGRDQTRSNNSQNYQRKCEMKRISSNSFKDNKTSFQRRLIEHIVTSIAYYTPIPDTRSGDHIGRSRPGGPGYRAGRKDGWSSRVTL